MNTPVLTGASLRLAPTVIQLNANQIACIKEFAARKDVRYYLNAIHFRTDGSRAYMSATDGHMGAILRSSEGAVTGPDISWIVPIELFDRLGKSPVTLTFSAPAARYEEGEVDTASVSDGSAGNSQSAYEQSPHPSKLVKPKELQVGHWCCEVTLAQGESKRSIQSLAAGCHYPAIGGLFPTETGQVAVQLDQALVARVYKAYAALKSGDGLSKRRKGQQGIHTHPIFGYPTKADSVVLLDFRDPDFTGLIMPLRGMEKANHPDWLPVYTQQQTSKPLLEAATALNQTQLAKYKVARKQELKAEKEALAARMNLARKQRLARFEAEQEQALANQPDSSQERKKEGESLAIEVAAAVATTAAEPTCKATTLATPTIRLPARIQVPQALLEMGIGTGSGLGTGNGSRVGTGLNAHPASGVRSATVSVPWREVTGMVEGIGAV